MLAVGAELEEEGEEEEGDTDRRLWVMGYG